MTKSFWVNQYVYIRENSHLFLNRLEFDNNSIKIMNNVYRILKMKLFGKSIYIRNKLVTKCSALKLFLKSRFKTVLFKNAKEYLPSM